MVLVLDIHILQNQNIFFPTLNNLNFYINLNKFIKSCKSLESISIDQNSYVFLPNRLKKYILGHHFNSDVYFLVKKENIELTGYKNMEDIRKDILNNKQNILRFENKDFQIFTKSGQYCNYSLMNSKFMN